MRNKYQRSGVLATAASVALLMSIGISSAAPRTENLDSLGTAPGNEASTTSLIAEVNLIERNEAGNIVSVTWSIENQGSERVVLTWLRGRSYIYSGGNYAGVTVTDGEGTSRFHPVMDSLGECLCSGKNSNSFKERLEPGDKVAYWSIFSLPEDIEEVTIEIPRFEPIEDIPIS
jgi:hypothetical protein